MKINSKELVQSYILTTAKYDFSVYEKLILYRLVEFAQADLKGKHLNSSYIIGETLFKDKIMKMPVSLFLKNPKDKNYSRIKKAFLSLNDKSLIYEDDKVWEVIRIIEKPKIDKYDEFVMFEVQPKIWEAILNFSKGFSTYDLDIAVTFESVYSMRFYELFSNNLRPLTFTIEQLKERFKIQNKYKNRPLNFVDKVVYPAKKELDKKSPYSFEYKLIKTGRKTTAIKFFPYKIAENVNKEAETERLQLQMSSSWSIPLEVSRYLKQKYGFEEKGIRANIDLFKTAYLEFDLLKFLAELYPSAKNANSVQAYTIGALKKYISNKKNKAVKSNDAVNQINDLANKFKT